MKGHQFAWWQRQRLQKQLHQAQDARVYRRTLALLEYDRGEKVSHIAQRLDVDRRSIQRWIAAFAQASDPQALRDGSRPGRPPRWTQDTSGCFEALLATAPGQWGYQAVDWTMPLLGKALCRLSGQAYSRSTIWRELRRRDYGWKRSRYVLRPDPQREKKTPDSAEIAPSSTPRRDPGHGRDRPAAVPAAACRLESARPEARGGPERL